MYGTDKEGDHMPNYYNPYYPQAYMPQPMPQAQAQTQIQNGGFVSVRSEEEARNYPVALGNSVTFKDENSPYIYTKTMGFSQLDRPIFDKYKLVKEEPSEASNSPQIESKTSEPIKDTIDSIKSEIEAIWSDIDGIKHDYVRKADESPAKRTTKRDKDGDD